MSKVACDLYKYSAFLFEICVTDSSTSLKKTFRLFNTVYPLRRSIELPNTTKMSRVLLTGTCH